MAMTPEGEEAVERDYGLWLDKQAEGLGVTPGEVEGVVHDLIYRKMERLDYADLDRLNAPPTTAAEFTDRVRDILGLP